MPVEFKIFLFAVILFTGIAINLIILGYFDDFLVVFQKHLFEIPERYKPVFLSFLLFVANAIFWRYVFSNTCQSQMEDECFKKELELKLLRAYRDKKERET
jgi:hypothetical protein